MYESSDWHECLPMAKMGIGRQMKWKKNELVAEEK